MSINITTDSAIKQTYRMVDIIYCEDKSLRATLAALEIAYMVTIQWTREQTNTITTQMIIDRFLITLQEVFTIPIFKTIVDKLVEINKGG